jgi:mRNA-degrading endonuclease RelE of RelBE toxin-antitoxin system
VKYTLIYTESYISKAHQFIKKHPELLAQYEKTLRILELNPYHPALRLHQLKDLHSVSINISYRITLEFYFDDKAIVLVNVGHHDKVY